MYWKVKLLVEKDVSKYTNWRLCKFHLKIPPRKCFRFTLPPKMVVRKFSRGEVENYLKCVFVDSQSKYFQRNVEELPQNFVCDSLNFVTWFYSLVFCKWLIWEIISDILRFSTWNNPSMTMPAAGETFTWNCALLCSSTSITIFSFI